MILWENLFHYKLIIFSLDWPALKVYAEEKLKVPSHYLADATFFFVTSLAETAAYSFSTLFNFVISLALYSYQMNISLAIAIDEIMELKQ